MDAQTSSVEQYNCQNCGGKLVYTPGTSHLTCEPCGSTQEIQVSDEAVVELDFETHLAGKASAEEQITVHTVKCEGCGATVTLDANVESENCVYCATPLVVANAHDESIIRPKSLLPFAVKKKDAIEGFKKWLTGYFWIPNQLKKASINPKQFRGAYLPFWTYDSQTDSDYRGERGEYYYVTESYTDSDGKRQTREVRKTRWYPAYGRVMLPFDDVLVGASDSIPEKYMNKLEPWDLPSLVPFDNQFLSGYVTEKYQVDLKEGWGKAKAVMEPSIRDAVRRDIGGDEQRVHNINTSYEDTTFKHILLPVYLSSYKYKDKLYKFFVNARTGEVQGKRPISTTKVVLAVLLGLLVIGGIVAGIYWEDILHWWNMRQAPAPAAAPSAWLKSIASHWLRLG